MNLQHTPLLEAVTLTLFCFNIIIVLTFISSGLIVPQSFVDSFNFYFMM